MRFGISETSWMLPKILRMRFDAVDCVARRGLLGAVVAMRILSPYLRGGAPIKSPQRRLGSMPPRRPLGKSEGEAQCKSRPETQKAASPHPGDRSFSVLKTPPDQCVERAARRRVLFRYEWGVGAR